MPMLRRILAAVVVIGAPAAPRGASASDTDASAGRIGAPGEPRAFAPHADELAHMLADVDAGCRSEAERSLRGGRARHDCAKKAMQASRRRLRHSPERFGVVLHRRVDLLGVRLVVAQASACREWPTSSRSRILAEFDALAAGCRLRPYRGALALVVVDADGRRRETMRVHADREGVVRFRFADVDAAVRDGGLGTLDDWRALQAGHDSWAGRFDLVRLHGLLADYHLGWVRRGRGSPALFALRHPEHPRSQIAVDLAVEANLARQQRDFVAVERGVLPPAAFLDRYVWSPMRHSVESMLAELRKGSPRSASSVESSTSTGSSVSVGASYPGGS
jgi:hypothetical protein